MRTISKTEIQTYRRCRREHYYGYELRMRPVEKSDALRVGSIHDAALETWWRTLDLAKVLGVIETKAQDAYEAARLSALMVGYDARWKHEEIDVLAVQEPFYSSLSKPLEFAEGGGIEGVRFGGVFDAVVRYRATGRVSLVESKSSKENITPGSWFWKRTMLDIQISHYLDAGKRFGATELVYDVSRKPDLEPLKASKEIKYRKDGQPYANTRLADETPEEYGERCLKAIREDPESYYQRPTIVRLAEEAKEAERDLLLTVASLVRDRGPRPRNPDACLRYGSACPYYGVCTGSVEITNTNLFTNERSHL